MLIGSRRKRRIAVGLIFALITASVMGSGKAPSETDVSFAADKEKTASEELLHIIDAEEPVSSFSYSQNSRIKRAPSAGMVESGTPWITDKGFPEQWHLTDIGAPQVWTEIEEKGRHPGEGIVVAVVDTGTDVSHYDLKDNLWTNAAELNGVTGVDDDQNGYVDDIYGVNIVKPGSPMEDTNGHGTQMAGIIAMGAGNAGAVGVAYGAKIMSVKVAVGDTFSSEDAVKGIRYAVANGADIISMSYSTQTISASLKKALKEASEKCVLVAAAGNEAITSLTPSYPAAYDFVVGVMSYGRTEVLSSFTNWDSSPGFGDEYDIAAPGEDIISSIPNGYHTKKNGTSHATAVVSGAMAVALAELRAKGERPDPYSFQTYFIRNMLHRTVPDAAHGNLVFPRVYLPDVVDDPTVPLMTVTPIPTETPTAMPTAASTSLPTVPTVVPTTAPSVAPVQTVGPVATPTPYVASPTPTPTVSPSGSHGKLEKGVMVSAGSGKNRAIYRVKNPKKKTVIYHLCNVKNKVKTAWIPSRIRLSDGSWYKVVGVSKRSFRFKKNVKTVNVYAGGISRSRMRKAIRGSGVEWVVFK